MIPPLIGWLEDRSSRLNDVWFERTVAILLALFVGVQLALTLTYKPTARIGPLMIGIPTLAMSLLILLRTTRYWHEVVEGSPHASDDSDTSSLIESLGLEVPKTSSTPEEQASDRTRLLRAILWVAFLFSLIVSIGFFAAGFVFLILFYRHQSGQTWLRSMAYTSRILVFVYVIFRVVLNVPLYPGLFRIILF